MFRDISQFTYMVYSRISRFYLLVYDFCYAFAKIEYLILYKTNKEIENQK